jgi:hypothetical protein
MTTWGDLRRATAELPDSAPVHLADADALRALGEPLVWKGSVYLPILEATEPTPSPVGVQMRWADEDRGLHVPEGKDDGVCSACDQRLVPGCCPAGTPPELTERERLHGSAMTVRELIALLDEWPLLSPVYFGDTPGRPPEYMDGEPVTVDGVTLPDGLYIGWLSAGQREALGWPVKS